MRFSTILILSTFLYASVVNAAPVPQQLGESAFSPDGQMGAAKDTNFGGGLLADVEDSGERLEEFGLH